MFYCQGINPYLLMVCNVLSADWGGVMVSKILFKYANPFQMKLVSKRGVQYIQIITIKYPIDIED